MSTEQLFFIIMFSIMGLALLLLAYRLIKGPTTPDRIVSIDAMTTLFVSILVFLSYLFKRAIYLDVAFIYAILAFVSVLVIARYLERGL